MAGKLFQQLVKKIGKGKGEYTHGLAKLNAERREAKQKQPCFVYDILDFFLVGIPTLVTLQIN